MNDELIGEQDTDAESPDLIGVYRQNPTVTSTAAYNESMVMAYKVAQLAGDEARVAKYRQAIELTTKFLLQNQYTEKNAYFALKKDKAVGGFRDSLVKTTERIDTTQHAVAGLIEVWRQIKNIGIE